MHLPSSLRDSVRQKTPRAPERNASITAGRSEESSSIITRVAGEVVQISRHNSNPAVALSASRALIRATCGCSRLTMARMSAVLDAAPAILNCPSRDSASTSNCVFMEVLSAARTRMRSCCGKLVTWAIFLSAYCVPGRESLVSRWLLLRVDNGSVKASLKGGTTDAKQTTGREILPPSLALARIRQKLMKTRY